MKRNRHSRADDTVAHAKFRFIQAANAAGFFELSADSKEKVIRDLEQFAIEVRNPIKVQYEPNASSYSFVINLLNVAFRTGKSERVVKHLVGAALEYRFPALTIENKRSSAADQQRNRPGDFKVGDTVFHVTHAPGPLLWSKIEANLKQGLQVYVIVPEISTVGAKQNADQIDRARIAVVSLEGFIAQNMDELSEFGRSRQRQQIAALLQVYNRRVDEVELDKSLLIELPANLID